MSARFGLVVKFTLKPGHEDVFDQLVGSTLPHIQRDEPGTLIYTCHEVEGAASERVFYELYEDRAAFDVHENQPHVRHFLAERGQHLDKVAVDFLSFVAGKGLPSGA